MNPVDLTVWAGADEEPPPPNADLDGARAAVVQELDAPVDELEAEACEVIQWHALNLEPDFERVKSLLPEGSDVVARVKELPSLLEKLARRSDKYDAPHKVEDVTGFAVVVPELRYVLDTVEQLRGEYEVIDEDDAITEPKPPWMYRGYHLTIIGAAGQPIEVQVRAPGAERYAMWQHRLYKPETPEQAAMSDAPPQALLDYCAALSEYFNAIDLGQDPGPLPAQPPEVAAVFGAPVVDAHTEPTDAVAAVGDNLFIGAAPLPDTVGFDTIVLVAPEYQPADEEFPGAEVLRFPLDEHATGSELAGDAERVAQWVNVRRSEGKRVLVTCKQGFNRSALVAALALVLGDEQLDAQSAVDRVRVARGPRAFERPAVLDALRLGR